MPGSGTRWKNSPLAHAVTHNSFRIINSLHMFHSLDEVRQSLHTKPERFSSKNREVLYARSLHYIFNSKNETKIKWFQQGWFSAVMIIIAIVITILDWGSDGGSVRASALGMNNHHCHTPPEKIVNIQHVMPSSCKPIENHVYSRLLDPSNDTDERHDFDAMLERNRRSAPSQQWDAA